MSSGGFGADLGVLPARYIPRALAARSPRSPCPSVTLLSPLKDLQYKQPSEWEVISGREVGTTWASLVVMEMFFTLSFINVSFLVVIFTTVLQDVRGNLGKEYIGSLSYFLQRYLNLQVSQRHIRVLKISLYNVDVGSTDLR